MVAKKENLFIISCTNVTTSVPHQRSKFASNLPDLSTTVVSVLNTCAFDLFSVGVERPFHISQHTWPITCVCQISEGSVDHLTTAFYLKKISLTFYLHQCPETGINSPQTSKDTSFFQNCIVIIVCLLYARLILMTKISTSLNQLAIYKQTQLQRHYEDNILG